jgi:hypothetical protein
LKTNVGHGGAISGIFSIIKATLALENELIPPTIGIRRTNPELQLEKRNIKVVTELTPWPKNALKRISINSFGYGEQMHTLFWILRTWAWLEAKTEKKRMTAYRVLPVEGFSPFYSHYQPVPRILSLK